MATSQKLWLGFGTLTALLLLFGVTLTVRLRSIEQQIDKMANVARPRAAAARELESKTVGYALAVRTFTQTDDPKLLEKAASIATELERNLADYQQLAMTKRQQELGTRCEVLWRELKSFGQVILDSQERPLGKINSERLADLRNKLERLLNDEMQPEAVASYNARKEETFSEVQAIIGLAVILLVGSVCIAILMSATVGKAVVGRERAVAEQSERLRITLASIGDAVIATDDLGRITSMNFMAESLTGWTNEVALGQPLDTVFKIVNEATSQPLGNLALKVLREGRNVGLPNQNILIARDGTERLIDESAAPIRIKEGQKVGCVLVFRDVTERRRAELLLTNQNQILERVVCGGPITEVLDALCLTVERHIAGNVIATVLLMDEGETMLRPKAGSKCPREYSAAINPVPVGPSSGSCGTAVFRGEPVVVSDIASDPLWAEYKHLALSHDLRACWSVPIFSSARKVLGTFAVYSPVPRQPNDHDLRVMEFLARTAGIAIERERSERAVRESELRYRLVGDAANDAIWDWNLVTNQVTWNEGVQTRFGYKAEEIGADTTWWVDNIHPDDRERNSQHIHAVIDGPEERWSNEYRFRRADGSYAEVSDRGRVVRDGSGRPSRMVGSMLDLTEQKRAEQERADAQRTLYDLVERCPFGIYIVDSDFRLASLNLGTQTGTFANFNPAVGRPFDEAMRVLWPEPVATEVIKIFRHTLETGQPYFSRDFESPRADIDKTESYEWELHRILLSGGRHGVVCYYYDSTKLRQTERELRFQLDLTKSITDTATTALFMMDEKSRCTFMNPAAVAMTGFSFEEVQGGILHDFIHHHHPDGRPYPMPECPIDRALPEHGEVRDHEDVFIRKDGEYFPVLVNARVIFKQGVAVGTFVEVRDITEQKAFVRELENREAHLRRILNGTICFVGVLDREGRLIEVNEPALIAGGVTREQVLGTPFADTFWWNFDDQVAQQIREAVAIVAAGGTFRRDLRYRLGTDERRWVDFSLNPIIDGNGDVSFMVPSGVDVTNRYEFESKLRDARAAAESANLSKSAFLANMSHEIRTPMTAILGYTDLIADKVTDAEVAEHLKTIRRNGGFLLDIINDILDLSKIEVDKLELSCEEFSLVGLLEDVCSIMSLRASEKGIDVDLSLSPRLPDLVKTDAKRLKQILVNLVGNAVKFTEAGNVTILADFEDSRLKFRVVDTGIGMSEEQLQKLFKPFSQGDLEVNRMYGGTGLGLAISKRLAEMMGGRIEVESKIGVGSSFYVEIVAEAVKSNKPLSADSVLSGSDQLVENSVQLNCSVLIVDDRRDIRHLSRAIAARAGATVSEAVDGEQALAIVSAAIAGDAPPDVVVLDMQMPKLDGYETAKGLRRLGYSGPIIALTANAMQGDKDRCIESGCNDYLSKPINTKEFLATISKHTQPSVARPS
jgi:PAS domain S-box-containing protein